jgi:Spy/CpxP family protein refolding chaperone
MTITKKFLTLALAATLVGAGGVALARGPGGHGKGGFFGHRINRLLKKLDLREDQEDMALRFHVDMRKKRKAMKKDMASTMNAVSVELAKQQPDSARLHKLADQRLEAMRGMMHERIDAVLQIHATLDQQQRDKLTHELKRASKRARILLED